MISVAGASLNSDPFCVKLQGAQCLSCSSGYYLSISNNTCTQLNPLCKSSDNNGYCTECYPGYIVSSNTCIVAASIDIPYCFTYSGVNCTSCINGYYLTNGTCFVANMLCSSYDPNSGTCYSCIQGYVFQQGQCIYPALGPDPFCTFYSSAYCSQCTNGYSLQNYICVPIDPNCSQFDSLNNICRQCSNNKIPSGPNCS